MDKVPRIKEVAGIIRLAAIIITNIFSIFVKPIRETAINNNPIENIIDLTPNDGINKNTVTNVPIMLPPVDIEYKFPEMPPIVVMSLTVNLIAYGEIIPSKIVGTVKSKVVASNGLN